MSSTPPKERGWLASLVVLLSSLAAGATLRFESLREPSLWLDEILGYDLTSAAASRPWWSWIIGFDAEHGPLYYLTQLPGRIASDPELAARWVPAVFGVAAIGVVWLAARHAWDGYTAAAAAAAILATSPLHVYYSREARPYSLAMLLGAVMIVALLRRSWVFYPAVAAALYTSAVAAPLILGAAAAAAISGWLERDAELRRRDWTAAAFAAAGLGIVPWLYRGYGTSTTGVNFPEVTASFVDSLVRAFAVTAIGSDERGRTAVIIVILAIVGAATLVMRDRRRGAIVMTMTVLPAAAALVALRLTDHWFAVRYISTALPAYVILAGSGIAALSRMATERLRRGWIVEWVPVMVLVAIVWMQTIPVARYEPYQKLDWSSVASAIASHAQKEDLVVTAEGWSTVSLGFYLRRIPGSPRLLEATDPALAERFSADGRRVWFVTAGHTTDFRMREWLCRFPVVLSSRLENLRVHYAPDISDFLRGRSLPSERRALAGDHLLLDLSPRDDLFLGDGWSDAEGSGADSFRWVVGRKAVVTVPLVGRANRTIRMHASPLEHPSLPHQTMRWTLNGVPVGNFVMSSGVAEYEAAVPAARWNEEGANVLEIELGRANAPADLDPAHKDPRALSAAFHTIEVGSGNGGKAPPIRTVRLHGPLLDDRTVWRDVESRLPELDRRSVEQLLIRLGLDPTSVWPRIASGELALEPLLETVATSSVCEDDRAFVRRAWLTVFARTPNEVEERTLLSLLAAERSRVALMQRIGRMSEFRDAYRSRTASR